MVAAYAISISSLRLDGTRLALKLRQAMGGLGGLHTSPVPGRSWARGYRHGPPSPGLRPTAPLPPPETLPHARGGDMPTGGPHLYSATALWWRTTAVNANWAAYC